jgi:light-regulated signal transduction histidine kinase (bacteriophytochrome)
MIVLYDANLRIMAIEGGAVERLPQPVSSIVGHRLDELLSSEAFEAIEPHYRAAIAGERVSFDYDDPDGRTVWWTTAMPMYNDAGLVVGGMAQWRDVTGRVQAERAMEQYAFELERSHAELEQFAYIASHDLSEPLRMVTGYLSLLERRYADKLDEDAEQFIGFAVDGATRMRGLIDDLLAFSRVGRAELAREQVNAQELVDEAFRTVTAEREGPEPALLATSLPIVTGDAGQLSQLFQNLLSNAVKFVEPGHAPVIEVTAHLLDDGSGWRFVVADDGIGIDAAQAERIFGMFQRLHTRDEFPGSGVGLAIARKVVERHGGTIWAQPRPGGGTRVVFELRSPA